MNSCNTKKPCDSSYNDRVVDREFDKCAEILNEVSDLVSSKRILGRSFRAASTLFRNADYKQKCLKHVLYLTLGRKIYLEIMREWKREKTTL